MADKVSGGAGSAPRHIECSGLAFRQPIAATRLWPLPRRLSVLHPTALALAQPADASVTRKTITGRYD